MKEDLEYGHALYSVGSLLSLVVSQEPYGDGRDQWESAEHLLRDGPRHAPQLLRSLEAFYAEVPAGQQRYDFFEVTPDDFDDPTQLDRFLTDVQRRCREIIAGEAGEPLSAPWLEPVFGPGDPLFALQEVLRWVYGYEGDDLLSGLYATALRRLSTEELVALNASLDALAAVPTRRGRFQLMLQGAMRSPDYADQIAAELRRQIPLLLAGYHDVPFELPHRYEPRDVD